MEPFQDPQGESGHILAGGKHGFERLSLIAAQTEPGGGPPLHTHRTEEPHFVYEGRVHYLIGETAFIAEGPYAVWIPANMPHTFRNLGARPLRILGVVPDGDVGGGYAELGPNPLIR
jgi:mannose-6-phosphate isomerase-like protein (cupin superfamily)